MNQIKCLQPPEHAGVLLNNPPQYRCYRDGCHKTWVVGTEAPECTMNQIPNIEEPHNTREVEEIAEKLHIWYLEAVKQEGSKYNPDAVVPYKDLPEGSKLIDRYIANKLLHQLQKARQEERERIKKEVITDLTWYRIDEGVDEIERGVNYIKLSELREALNHSELDQPTNTISHTCTGKDTALFVDGKLVPLPAELDQDKQ